MIQEKRRFWKLLLFTLPTLGIYNIYFWYRMTQDINEMNREDKKIKNYILVLFLSIITLGIYRWVWFFYLADRIQVTGKRMGIKVHPGAGTILGIRLYGTFLFLLGPIISNIIVIHNMNTVARIYNASLKNNTTVVDDVALDTPVTTNEKKKPIEDNTKKTSLEKTSAQTVDAPKASKTQEDKKPVDNKRVDIKTPTLEESSASIEAKRAAEAKLKAEVEKNVVETMAKAEAEKRAQQAAKRAAEKSKSLAAATTEDNKTAKDSMTSVKSTVTIGMEEDLEPF